MISRPPHVHEADWIKMSQPEKEQQVDLHAHNKRYAALVARVLDTKDGKRLLDETERLHRLRRPIETGDEWDQAHCDPTRLAVRTGKRAIIDNLRDWIRQAHQYEAEEGMTFHE